MGKLRKIWNDNLIVCITQANYEESTRILPTVKNEEEDISFFGINKIILFHCFPSGNHGQEKENPEDYIQDDMMTKLGRSQEKIIQ